MQQKAIAKLSYKSVEPHQFWPETERDLMCQTNESEHVMKFEHEHKHFQHYTDPFGIQPRYSTSWTRLVDVKTYVYPHHSLHVNPKERVPSSNPLFLFFPFLSPLSLWTSSHLICCHIPSLTLIFLLFLTCSLLPAPSMISPLPLFTHFYHFSTIPILRLCILIRMHPLLFLLSSNFMHIRMRRWRMGIVEKW